LPLRIEKLYGLGRTLVRHGKVERGAEIFAQEALHLAQQIEDHNSISNAYATLGMIAQARGKLNEAETAFTASYTHASQIGQSGLMSRALVGLAELAGMRGNVASAITLLEEALANATTAGMTWDIPVILTLLGHMVSQQQNYALAKAHYRKALRLYRTFNSPTYIASCLERYAVVACAEEQYAQATRLCAAAAILREQTQTELLPAEREACEQIVARASATLDERAFEEEWATGIRLTHEQAIDYALSDACL
jgi:tetratricopeptide (TPR) repeat protein